jgi:hypothetical protein
METKRANEVEDDDLVVRMLTNLQISPLDGDDPLLLLTVDYFENVEDMELGLETKINFTLEANAALKIGAALMDSANKRLADPHQKH